MSPRRWMQTLLVCIGIAIAAGVAPVRSFAGGMPPLEATVLFFNDIHGHLRPFTVTTDRGKQEMDTIGAGGAVFAGIEGRIVRLPE